MATRSTISVQDNDGKIKTIYCHWDGYPSNNGRLLLENYDSIDKVNDLISLGDISSLREKPFPNPTKPHSFDIPQADVVIAYHRDRNEELCIDEYSTKEEIRGEEYDYIFIGEKWYVREGKEFNLLTKEMCEFE
jgi:hypothetical protein